MAFIIWSALKILLIRKAKSKPYKTKKKLQSYDSKILKQTLIIW